MMPSSPTRAACLTLLLVFLAFSPARAQDTLRPRYGVAGGVNINTHSADFRALPGVPNCCPRFTAGSGFGVAAGALAEFPFAFDFLFTLRAEYIDHRALLSEREAVTVIVDGARQNGAFEHRVDATISSIGLQPGVAWRLLDHLFLSAGVRGALLLQRDYQQEERIVEPLDRGTFLDSAGTDSHSRVRNARSGELPNSASLLVQPTLGLSYELPLNRRGTLLLVPEVSFAFALTDIVGGVDWRTHGLRAGIALKYSPAPKPFRYDTAVARDTVTRDVPWGTAAGIALDSRTSETTQIAEADSILVLTSINEHWLRTVPQPPPMRCAISATGVDDNGAESPAAALRIEEFLSTTAHPLLNYVFFDPGSATLPSRYTTLTQAQASTFTSDALRGGGTLPVYYSMLNIVGQRMQKYPGATLTITGCTMDVAEERGDSALGRRRAETVRDYLVGTWGISPNRLRIEGRGLPAKRSNPQTSDGQTENRRVELTASSPEILDVLITSDTTRVTSPPIVRLHPAITSVQGVDRWEVTVAQRGVVLKRFSGTGTPPASLDWDIANDQAHAPRYDGPLQISLNGSSPAGERTGCTAALTTEVVTVAQKRANRAGDYTIDRYNLILFNVGESGITPNNQRIVDMVRSRLTPRSELTVEGFADRSGNAAGNERLSATRARAAAQALGRADATTRGIGESRLLYPNDTPEGRFYCRTVQILVKTPVAP